MTTSTKKLLAQAAIYGTVCLACVACTLKLNDKLDETLHGIAARNKRDWAKNKGNYDSVVIDVDFVETVVG
jgi:hypothetical protein